MKKILSAAILVGVFIAGMLVASIPSSPLQAEAAQDDEPRSLEGRLASIEKVLGKIVNRLDRINMNLEPGDVPPESAPVINAILDSIKAHLNNMLNTVDQLKAKIGP
ncbi:MAG: hypothetical protein ACRD38_11975 [Nitrososphaerales archaeon]